MKLGAVENSVETLIVEGEKISSVNDTRALAPVDFVVSHARYIASSSCASETVAKELIAQILLDTRAGPPKMAVPAKLKSRVLSSR